MTINVACLSHGISVAGEMLDANQIFVSLKIRYFFVFVFVFPSEVCRFLSSPLGLTLSAFTLDMCMCVLMCVSIFP